MCKAHIFFSLIFLILAFEKCPCILAALIQIEKKALTDFFARQR
ncbi:hypothetical protein DORFOR_01823 [Dorea formicigenerans ATCC 27755]|uniref:Uncharacterized protein n=1 Tax=Dorea formicigenerans ATCC 27755 TaxID=411461 RepID=B0G791_9FIRM|nr:hypothetical protein DORFOR_01823 [Dorea formicigenerans ATCC 27755]